MPIPSIGKDKENIIVEETFQLSSIEKEEYKQKLFMLKSK